jgi:GT2 family glycosyltransferase
MSDQKTLLVYAPLTLESISSKTFRSFVEMTSPEVQEKLAEKGIKVRFLVHDKFPIDLNRNDAFNLAVSNKYNADYLMCCDMDQVFKKDTILKLLETLDEEPEADGVTGVYYTKSPPHRAVVGKYSPWSDTLEAKRGSLEAQGFIAPDGQQTLYYKHLKFFDVVQRVHVFGIGCLLLKTECFKKLEQPFFKYVNGYSTGGDFTFQGHSEDMWFCSQLYQKGIKILVNPKVQVGHVVQKVIHGNEADE